MKITSYEDLDLLEGEKSLNIYYKKKKIIKKVISLKRKNKKVYKIKNFDKEKINFLFFSLKNIIIFLICLFILLLSIIIIFLINKTKKKKIKGSNDILGIQYDIIKKIDDDEFEKIKDFINSKVYNNNLDNSDSMFENTYNVNISIIIPVFNGEQSIKKGLSSILNQDFKKFEVIYIDDYSQDNSVNIIKEFMAKDKRIKLIRNEENKGMLYSKYIGAEKAKGNYIMFLNQDDFYIQSNTFSILNEEAEKNKLDMIGFASIIGDDYNIENKNIKINHYIETPIMIQPEITNTLYKKTSNGQIIRYFDFLSNYFFNREFFIFSINYIKNYNEKKINYVDDSILYFITSRNANYLKHLKNVFHFRSNSNKTIINTKFENEESLKQEDNIRCLSYLYYVQFLFDHTIDTKTEKYIISFVYENLFLNNKCRYNINIREEAKKTAKLFLDDQYMIEEEKNKIQIFMNEIEQL